MWCNKARESLRLSCASSSRELQYSMQTMQRVATPDDARLCNTTHVTLESRAIVMSSVSSRSCLPSDGKETTRGKPARDNNYNFSPPARRTVGSLLLSRSTSAMQSLSALKLLMIALLASAGALPGKAGGKAGGKGAGGPGATKSPAASAVSIAPIAPFAYSLGPA